MVTAQELAEKAMELAEGCLSGRADELYEVAGEDPDLVTRASQIVRAHRSRAPETDRQVEHLAFILLTSVFTRMREETA